MLILVPEAKRLINLERHGFDLNDFEIEFSWTRYARVPARPRRTGRRREMLIGTMLGHVVAAIVYPLGSEAVAVISIRIADEKERTAYEALHRLDEGG